MDSSVWVDFFSSKPGRGGAELRRMIEESEPFALTGVVVAEVLQGLTRDSSRIEGFLAQWDMLEPQGFETYRQAAAMYRAARARGSFTHDHRYPHCCYCPGARRKRVYARPGFLPNCADDGVGAVYRF